MMPAALKYAIFAAWVALLLASPFLGGNYVCGVAFGSCVEWGVDTAPKVLEYLERNKATKEEPAASAV